jgi:mannose-6-phosphate isomerase-like protein (cupin superfamily)
MPKLVSKPTRIPVPGNKLVEEYIGRVNSSDGAVSIAHMHSPTGWTEPGQQPEFDEFTLVLRGRLLVESKEGTFEVRAGQAVIARRGEWVRYSTPEPEGAEYVAICLPAFELASAHRDA